MPGQGAFHQSITLRAIQEKYNRTSIRAASAAGEHQRRPDNSPVGSGMVTRPPASPGHGGTYIITPLIEDNSAEYYDKNKYIKSFTNR
jgi:hypothetical protein